MDFQEFGNKLRRINKTLIHFEDVFYPSGNGNKRGIFGKGTVLAPYYSKPSKYNQEIMEIREKSTELANKLEEFNKTLPNYSQRRTFTQKPLPFLVTICGSKFNEEIFFDTLGHYGRDNFVAIFNKTIKEYIENKLQYTENHDVDYFQNEKYKRQIREINTWFNEFDFVPDHIKSFIDDKEKTDPFNGMTKQKEDISHFPLNDFKELKWQDIKIELVSDDSIRLAIKKKDYTKRFMYPELGMKDKRKGDLPTMLWKLLIQFSERNGLIENISFKGRSKLEKTISRFRVHLRNMTGLDGDPIPFNNKNKSYKTSFIILDKRDGSSNLESNLDIL